MNIPSNKSIWESVATVKVVSYKHTPTHNLVLGSEVEVKDIELNSEDVVLLVYNREYDFSQFINTKDCIAIKFKE